jgi:DNA-binding transcriptional ArsR family regulator
MGQYTVGRYLYNNGPSNSSEITRQTKDNFASVSQSLSELKKKEMVRRRDDGCWELCSDVEESRLEAIRPTPLSEIREQED